MSSGKLLSSALLAVVIGCSTQVSESTQPQCIYYLEPMPALSLELELVAEFEINPKWHHGKLGPVAATITNNLDHSVTICKAWPSIHLKVVDSSGNQISPFIECPTFGIDEESLETIEPGESFKMQTSFWTLAERLPIGNYRLQAVYDPQYLVNLATGGPHAEEFFQEVGLLYGPIEGKPMQVNIRHVEQETSDPSSDIG